MINSIYSSMPSFKDLHFKPGFNVLVADRTESATKEQTRNAAGKSSTLEIIHYLLGAKAPAKGFFSNKVFEDHYFGLIFNLGEHEVNVRRLAGSSRDRSRFYFAEPIPSFIEKELNSPKSGGEPFVSLKKWTEILGEYAFGLSNQKGSFQPTFRALFSYFCRRDENGGFASPFNQSKKQMDWDRNVMIAYLLGLDWRISSRIEKLRIDEQHLDKLRKELRDSGLLGQVIGKPSSIRSILAIEENKLKKFEREIESFQVLPQYREVEIEASLLAKSIAEYSNANTIDLRLIENFRESIREEIEPSQDDIERLYRAAGIQLPGVALKKIESVKDFHKKIISNRKSHLSDEIRLAEDRIEHRNTEMIRMDSRRKELMALLQTHGALDQYNKLQAELARIRAEVETLKRREEIAVKIEKGSADLELERARLHQSLLNDLNDRKERIDEAVLLYEQLSKEVSERSSILEIEATKRGLSFDITGGPDRSKGIREQQIFCFDMMLAIMNTRQANSLGFLVHDSHLFDAMDERQVANAIEAGARLSQEHGFQYIITMNSDRIPYADFSKSFNFDDYVIDIRLTNDTETGGLFGIRF